MWEKKEVLGSDAYFYALAFAPVSECKSQMIMKSTTRKGYVLGEARGIYKILRLANNVCEVTLVSQGSAKGKVPTWITNLRMTKTLALVMNVQELYKRNGDTVDKVRRESPPSLTDNIV